MADDDYAKLSDEEEQKESAEKPWLRLGGMLLSCGIASGLSPGQAVWVSLLGNHGVFSYLCGVDTHIPCDNQLLAMGLIFTITKMLSIMLLVLAGTLFDKVGGRKLGTIGGLMVLVGFLLLQICIIGPQFGLDRMTSTLLAPVALLIDAGSVFNSQSVLSILFHFQDIAGVVLAMLNATVDIAALLPVIMEALMAFGNFSLSTSLMVWTFAIGLSLYSSWICCPSHEEYLAQAEKVLGQKIDSRGVSVAKSFYDGHRVLYQNLFDHGFCLLMMGLGCMGVTIYQTNLCDYEIHLLHDFSAGILIANLSVPIVVFCGIIVVPLITYVGEVYGMKVVVASLVISSVVYWYVVLVPSRAAQGFCILIATYMFAVLQVVIQVRARAFAAPNKLGTICGLYGFYFALTIICLLVPVQTWIASLPEETRYSTGLRTMSTISTVSFTIYFLYFCYAGLPASPALLPEEEEQICWFYGCHSIEEVAYLLHFEQGGDASELKRKLSTVDQELHSALVLSIDQGRMALTLNKLRVEDFSRLLCTGFEWQRDLTKVDMDRNIFNRANVHNLLNRVANLSKFGTGSAKTVHQLETEVAKGRSKLVSGPDGQMTRFVNLVAVRIYSDITNKKDMLVQVAEKFVDGRERSKLQLPGTKMGPDDTLQMCVKRICTKICMDDSTATFSYHDAEASQYELESPSYPGVFTVYNKTTVTGYASATLPRKSFTVCDEVSKMTYAFEWMKAAEAIKKLAADDLDSLQAIAKSRSLSSSHSGQSPAPKETLGKVRTLFEIRWSLQVRENTKMFLKLLKSRDKNSFEAWLLTEPIDNIRHAFQDAADWPSYDAEKVFIQFREMMPHDDLVSVLNKRTDLQAVVVELYLGDLEREQQRLQKSTKKKLCDKGHPYWPYFQKLNWACESCGERFLDRKEGQHFRCHRCKVDICKACFEKVIERLAK